MAFLFNKPAYFAYRKLSILVSGAHIKTAKGRIKRLMTGELDFDAVFAADIFNFDIRKYFWINMVAYRP